MPAIASAAASTTGAAILSLDNNIERVTPFRKATVCAPDTPVARPVAARVVS
jgi:hypothetical protein